MVFELSPPVAGQSAWSETVLYRLKVSLDRTIPPMFPGVTLGAGGRLYAVVMGDYTGGMGMLFKLTPPLPGQTRWPYKVLHAFGSGNDGAAPSGSVLIDANGNLFGLTGGGGTNGAGTLYRYSP
jgi:hypothetical protein